MVGMILALVVVDWHAPGGRSPNYAVVATSNGAIVRRSALQATYLGPYGDRGFAVGVVSAAPFRGKRIVVESSVAMTVGSGGVDAFANVWGPEGILTDDDSDTQRRRLGSQASRRFGSQPERCTFVLDVPADAESIEVGLELSGPGEAEIRNALVDLAAPETAPTGRTLVTPISAETRLRVAAALRSVAVRFDEAGTAALRNAVATRNRVSAEIGVTSVRPVGAVSGAARSTRAFRISASPGPESSRPTSMDSASAGTSSTNVHRSGCEPNRLLACEPSRRRCVSLSSSVSTPSGPQTFANASTPPLPTVIATEDSTTILFPRKGAAETSPTANPRSPYRPRYVACSEFRRTIAPFDVGTTA